MTNISIAYRNETYIAPQVFPVVPVQNQSDKYFIFSKSDWFRNEAGMRAPATVGPIVEYSLTSGIYAAQPISAGKWVPDEVVDNADAPLRPRQEATEFATDKVQLYAEVEVAGNVFGNSVWSGSSTPSTLWDDNASNPLEDVETARESVAKTIGREPNVMVIGREVWTDLRHHPDLLDRIKYTATGIMTPQLLGQLFEVEKLLIGNAVYDTGEEGGTASYGFVWGKHAFVGYVSPRPGLMTPSAGYLFTWKNRQVERVRDPLRKADLVRVEWHYDDKVTASDAGYLLKSVVS
jgi:hypothetical protein